MQVEEGNSRVKVGTMFPFTDSSTEKKDTDSCRAGYISNQDLNPKWMNANELLLLSY